MIQGFAFTLLTSNEKFLVVTGDFQTNTDSHINRSVVMDLKLKNTAKKDQTVKGKGKL